MTNPPTTLKIAVITAIAPNIFPDNLVSSEKIRRAPRIVTAEIALVIDIKGVCSNGGTREIRK